MLNVLKFGGSILKNANDIKVIYDIATKNNSCVIVVSAFFGITDALIKTANLAAENIKEYKMQLEKIVIFHQEIATQLDIHSSSVTEIANKLEYLMENIFKSKDLTKENLDSIMSFGERFSSQIVHEFCQKTVNTSLVNPENLIKTDSNFGNANVDFTLTNGLISKKLQSCDAKYTIIPGFFASNAENKTTTLGRNGSDYTASIVAGAINAKILEIWKDVDGIYTADPKIVKNATLLDKISYQEALELSYFGNKVVCMNALFPVIRSNIPILIKNVQNPQCSGTLISNETNPNYQIKGITKIENITLISVSGVRMIGIPGFSRRTFSALHSADVNVILISQASSETNICFAVRCEDANFALNSLKQEFSCEIADQVINLKTKESQAIISIIGSGMAGIPGISGKIFSNLGRVSVNVNAIAQDLSEANISCVVNMECANRAVKTVHSSIFDSYTTIQIVLLGVGVVGNAVLEMVKSQKEYMLNKGINLEIMAIANSSKYIFSGDFSKENLENNGVKYENFHDVLQEIKLKYDLINPVIIDCTASEKIAYEYCSFVQLGFNIVTPNKKANVLPINTWKHLQKTLAGAGKHFFYEANVGAGLPIISTIQDLLNSGDEIIKIEGILSGTLSYIFNNLNPDRHFSEIVKDAQASGFTEPDPRDDLSGEDFARKLLILARMIGMEIDMSDIQVENLVPPSAQSVKLADLYSDLAKYDQDMQKRVSLAKDNNQVLRYVGIVAKDGVLAKIMPVDIGNPLASTRYTDNIISITTKYYNNSPLVVRGPGAGADITAIGVFSDLIKLANML